jgi:hypothetical protein
MSGPIRGIDGKLLVLEKGATGEPVVVGYVDSYSIKPSKDVQEISKINADSKEFISGLIGATCSAAGTFSEGDAQQELLFNQFFKLDKDGTPTPISSANLELTLRLKTGDPAGTGDEKKTIDIEFEAISSGLGVDVSSGAPHKWSWDGQVTGDITLKITTETT